MSVLRALQKQARGGLGQRIGHLDGPVLLKSGWRVLEQKRFLAGTPKPVDASGATARSSHGTQMAGLLAETAPEAGLLLGEVLGRGPLLARVALGFDWLINQTPAPGVICLPLGLTGRCEILNRLQQAAQERDILVVAAIGNSGANTGLSPACFAGVLAVGAERGRGEVAAFSGSLPATEETIAFKPEIVTNGFAPGGPTGQGTQGSSAASARVAGVAALLRAAMPDASAKDVFTALVEMAVPPAEAARHRVRHGMLDVAATWDRLLAGGGSTRSHKMRPKAPWSEAQLTPEIYFDGFGNSTRTIVMGFNDTNTRDRCRQAISDHRGEEAVKLFPLDSVPALIVQGPVPRLVQIIRDFPPIYCEDCASVPLWAKPEH